MASQVWLWCVVLGFTSLVGCQADPWDWKSPAAVQDRRASEEAKMNEWLERGIEEQPAGGPPYQGHALMPVAPNPSGP